LPQEIKVVFHPLVRQCSVVAMTTKKASKSSHNRKPFHKQEDNSPTIMNESTTTTTATATPERMKNKLFTESVPTTEEPSFYMDHTLSLSEYRILNPQVDEVPTLTQSRLLAAMLERISQKNRRQAEKQARRQRVTRQVKAAVLHPIKAMAALFHLSPQPALAMGRISLPSARNGATPTRVTSSYLALPRA
jgi:hypothetical protein